VWTFLTDIFFTLLDHWVYDFENEARVTASKLNKFLSSYDGVHILLKDRTEVGKELLLLFYGLNIE